MRKNITVRPARAAIAAVLALGSTPLLAQVADPAAPPPVAATQPAAPVVNVAPPPVASTSPVVAAPSTAPVMKPQSPVVQATPAPVVAEAAPEATAPAPVRSERVRAERPAQRTIAPVTEQTAAPAETVSPVAAPVTPVEPAPVAASSDTVSPAVPAADSTNLNPADNTALEWGLIGGGIVLLGGAGLLAMTRRRRLREENDVVLHAALRRESPVEPVVTPEPIAEPVPARTVITPAPAAPAYAMAARPSAGTGHGDLDAMVAAPPSAENPFRTRKNRLRRAHFLLRQGNPVVSQSQHAAVADVQPQVTKRPAPVFDFGGNMGQRRSWRPATT